MSNPDPDIINGLRSGSTLQHAAALRRFLDQNPRLLTRVHRLTKRYGGTSTDGDEIFYETLEIFERQVRTDGYSGQGSLAAYFWGIAQKVQFRHQKKIIKQKPINQSFAEAPELLHTNNPERLYLASEKKALLDALLNQLSEKCAIVLRMYHLDNSNQEIANALGMPTEGAAKRKVYVCKEKFRQLLLSNPQLLEVLDVFPRPRPTP